MKNGKREGKGVAVEILLKVVVGRHAVRKQVDRGALAVGESKAVQGLLMRWP